MAKLITTLWFYVLVILAIYSQSRTQCWESPSNNDLKKYSVDVEDDEILVRVKRSPDAEPQPVRYIIRYSGSSGSSSSSSTSSSSSSTTYYVLSIVFSVIFFILTLISCYFGYRRRCSN